MNKIRDLGRKIYDLDNLREKRRYLIFCARSLLHRRGMRELYAWFQADALRARALAANPFLMEQATRTFFYKGSTFQERVSLIREHVAFLQERLTEEAFLNLVNTDGKDALVWEMDYEGKAFRAIIGNEPGQRKEGLQSLELRWDEQLIYQIMFWLAKDESGAMSLYIGALQGPNMEAAKEIIKQLTKACHGYRTKNLALYMLRAVARSLGAEKIYAVTNEGYYAMNHLRTDRKLKTNFSDFWLEAGGLKTGDARFDELPLVEPRKTMEEVPTRKRAVYRKRFAFLDELDRGIAVNMQAILREGCR